MSDENEATDEELRAHSLRTAGADWVNQPDYSGSPEQMPKLINPSQPADDLSACSTNEEGTYCYTHKCGADDDEQCGLAGCPHCVELQRLKSGQPADELQPLFERQQAELGLLHASAEMGVKARGIAARLTTENKRLRKALEEIRSYPFVHAASYKVADRALRGEEKS